MGDSFAARFAAVPLNEAPGRIGPIGAVVGPTGMDPDLELRRAQALFLAPGVGAQGAAPEDVARVFGTCRERVIPSASRSLLVSGPDVGRLRDGAALLAAEFRRLLSSANEVQHVG